MPDPTSPGDTSEGIGSKALKAVRENLLAGIIGCISTIFASLGLLLTPLQESVLNWIQPPQARIAIIPSSSRPIVDEPVSVQALIVPSSISPMRGSIRFEFDAESLDLKEGQPGIPVQELRGPGQFPEVPLRFVPKRAGNTTVRVRFETEHGNFDAHVDLAVQSVVGELNVQVVSDSSAISERQHVNVQAILLPSTSGLDGILTFQTDSNHLQLLQGSATETFHNLNAPTKMPAESLQYVGREPGRTEIRLTVTTRLGQYNASLPIEILPASSNAIPSVDQPSGTWKIRLGDLQGQMQVLVVDTQVSGRFDLGEHHGAVTGTLDGSQFTAKLLRGEAPVRWSVSDGLWNGEAMAKGFLEIKAKAQLQRLTETGWIAEGPLEEFSAHSDRFARPPK